MMVYVIICVFIPSTLAAQINVEPVYLEVFQGDTITVDIMVYPQGSEVYSASYTFYFDNTLLNATSWTQGPFLSQDGNSSNIWVHTIDNPLGKFNYVECRRDTTVGVTNPEVLTTITFQVIGVKGTSLLNISDLEGELLYSTSGSIPTDINNGTCKIGEIINQTPTPTPTTTTPIQTQTTIPITPTPTATAIQTSAIASTPSSSSTIIKSPTTPVPPSEEKSNENNGLPGFEAIFAVTGLLMVSILKQKNVRK